MEKVDSNRVHHCSDFPNFVISETQHYTVRLNRVLLGDFFFKAYWMRANMCSAALGMAGKT